MFYHMGNQVPAQGILKPLWFLQTTGACGEILRSISRIPMFLIGCALAPSFAGNKRLPRWLLPVSAAATVPLMWLSLQMYKRGPFYSVRAITYFAYAVALVLLLSAIAEMLSRSRPGALVYRFFGFCGMISLEIYLIFSRLRILFGNLPGFSVHSCGCLKLDVATAICTLLCAVVLQRFTEAVIKAFSSVRIPAPEKE